MPDTLYFDIQLGASGDMLIASLIDAGLDSVTLIGELKKIGIEGWSVEPAKIQKFGISGTTARVNCRDEHHERTFADIETIINSSALSSSVKKQSLEVFSRLAVVEAAVHGTTPDRVHFHEVGALDSIIDTVAFCIALDLLGIHKIYFGEFCFGSGTVQSRHGEIPVPVPAVVELARGYSFRRSSHQGELITPTAAAILTTLATQLISFERPLVLSEVGIGFGTREHQNPSYTRAFLCSKTSMESESVFLLESNLDDINPQLLPYVIELVLTLGALDATITQVLMKKGRPGFILSVLAEESKASGIESAIFMETTTLGIRRHRVTRTKLDRETLKVHYHGSEVRIKIGRLEGKIVNIQPEYEDCLEAARRTGVPLKQIMEEVKQEFRRDKA